jgi:aminopeptidase
LTDPRLVKLAEVMIHYSLRLKKGHLFCIYGESVSTPLVIEAYREALRAGAHPNVRIKPDGLDQIFFGEASEEQLTYVSEFVRVETEKLDAMLYIWGSHNTRALSNCSPERMALCDRSRIDIFQRRLERIAKGEMTWCGTQYPTNAEAQEAEMSLAEYEDFVFKAGFLDRPDPVGEWKEISKRQDRIAGMLSKYRQIRVVAKDTDLTLNVAGRSWINCDGKENFPDGEIFTSPLEDSAEGSIRFSYPALYRKREANDVRLRFKSGRVVEARAAKGEDFLNSMIGMDEGARRIGEFSFGTNYQIQKFTKNTLFDEKIGGTIHVAIGASLPETGGVNVSALHWDMVCDLREDGEVYGDDTLIYKRGKFLTE